MLSVHAINEYLTQIIINNAKKFFKIKKIIPQTKHNLPISIRKIENNKSYINNTITHLSIYKQLLLNEISLNDKTISSSFNLTKFWDITQQKKLIKISSIYNIDFYWPQTITLNNYNEIKQHLMELKSKLMLDFNTHHHDWTQQKIEKFIVNRENNIMENQTKMINSILE
jgi:hypothetical protein